MMKSQIFSVSFILLVANCGSLPENAGKTSALRQPADHSSLGSYPQLIDSNGTAEFSFSFIKNDQNSLEAALAEASEFAKNKIQPKLNHILSQLGFSRISLENSVFIGKPKWQLTAPGHAPDYAPPLFQTLDLYSYMRVTREDGSGRSDVTLWQRKLVWADLSKDAVNKMLSTYNDAVLASHYNHQSRKVTWNLKISYADLAISFLSRNFLVFNDKDYNALWELFETPDPCTGMKDLLLSFIENNCKSLTGFKWKECSLDKKTGEYELLGKKHPEELMRTRVQFELDGKSLDLISDWRKHGSFERKLLDNMIKTILTLYYNKIFGST